MDENKKDVEEDFDIYEGIFYDNLNNIQKNEEKSEVGKYEDEEEKEKLSKLLEDYEYENYTEKDVNKSTLCNKKDELNNNYKKHEEECKLDNTALTASNFNFASTYLTHKNALPLKKAKSKKLQIVKKIGFVRKDTTLFLGVPPSLPEMTEERSHTQCILISNLAWWLNDVNLREVANEFGKVRALKILDHPFDGRSTGVALIEYTNSSDAAKAVEQIALSLVKKQGERPVKVQIISCELWKNLESCECHWSYGGAILFNLSQDIYNLAGVPSPVRYVHSNTESSMHMNTKSFSSSTKHRNNKNFWETDSHTNAHNNNNSNNNNTYNHSFSQSYLKAQKALEESNSDLKNLNLDHSDSTKSEEKNRDIKKFMQDGNQGAFSAAFPWFDPSILKIPQYSSKKKKRHEDKSEDEKSFDDEKGRKSRKKRKKSKSQKKKKSRQEKESYGGPQELLPSYYVGNELNSSNANIGVTGCGAASCTEAAKEFSCVNLSKVLLQENKQSAFLNVHTLSSQQKGFHSQVQNALQPSTTIMLSNPSSLSSISASVASQNINLNPYSHQEGAAAPSSPDLASPYMTPHDSYSFSTVAYQPTQSQRLLQASGMYNQARLSSGVEGGKPRHVSLCNKEADSFYHSSSNFSQAADRFPRHKAQHCANPTFLMKNAEYSKDELPLKQDKAYFAQRLMHDNNIVYNVNEDFNQHSAMIPLQSNCLTASNYMAYAQHTYAQNFKVFSSSASSLYNNTSSSQNSSLAAAPPQLLPKSCKLPRFLPSQHLNSNIEVDNYKNAAANRIGAVQRHDSSQHFPFAPDGSSSSSYIAYRNIVD